MSSTPTEGLSKADRIRRRPDYRMVQSLGERVHAPSFLVMVYARPDDGRRIGVTVTKKVGPAVTRNRIKRVVREVFRRNKALLPEGADVVFIAKKGAPGLDYDQLHDELSRASKALRAAEARSRAKRSRLDDLNPG